MFEHSTAEIKGRFKQAAFWAQSIRLKKGLKELLESAEISEESLLRLLGEEEITSERLLNALPRLIEQTLRQCKPLSDEVIALKREQIDRISFHTLIESASPLHKALSDKPFYRESDLATRRQLRTEAARFARRHRLTPSQAASLWEGSGRETSLGRFILGKCALWLPPVWTVISCVALGIVFWRSLSFWTIAFVLMLFCPIWEGYALLIEGVLRLLLPAAPLPSLQKEHAPAICAMLVASAKENPDRTLRALEILIAANKDADGLFGLILTLPDAPSAHSTDDATLCKPFSEAFERLQKRTDRPLRLCVAERSYLPREKRWRGSPTSDELITACHAMLSGERAGFSMIVGERQPSETPLALYIAPVRATLSPDGLRELACTLFHPLCPADCVLPILRTTDLGNSGALSRLVGRAVTLQKLGKTLPYSDSGMIRLSAITPSEERSPSFKLPCALAGSSLFVEALPDLPAANRSEANLFLHLLPALRARMGAILRLPLYLILITCPPSVMIGGLLLSNADLIAQGIISLSFGRRFVTRTLPSAFRIGKSALYRLIFPVRQCFEALPFIERLPFRYQTCLSILFSVFMGILTASRFPLPFSAIGLLWAISPLLSADPIKSKKALSAEERIKLLDIARKSWSFFEKQVDESHPLPPAYYMTDKPRSPCRQTSPEAFAFYLIACLSACDLGRIDPFTLERRVKAAMDAWEQLPTHHGLPYARYWLERGDSVEQSGVDTASCGLYALALAALASGLKEYSAQNDRLEALSLRVTALWRKMDFSLLYDSERSAFCEALLPNGMQIGRLDLLMSAAQAVCIASLAAGQIDRAAWKKLRRPAVGKGLVLNVQSMWGSLEEHLLPSLFLPSSEESLIGRARHHACRQIAEKPFGKAQLSGYAFAHTYLPDGSFSDKPLPSGQTSLAALQTDKPYKLAAPHALCLMLPYFSSDALKKLHRLEQKGAYGAFGFYEAIDCSDAENERIVRLSDSAHLGESMAAIVNSLTGNVFQRRLMRDPAFAALMPLLNEEFDLPETALPTRTVTLHTLKPTSSVTDDIPSLFLLGDNQWGLLCVSGRRIIPFYKGKPMASPASPHYLYEDGHFSGLLLFRDNDLITVPAEICRRERGAVTLAYRTGGAPIYATFTIPEAGLLSVTLSGGSIAPLFCYAPPPEGKPFRMETLSEAHILLIHAADRIAAVAADRLDERFIRSQEGPLPLGEAALSSLLDKASGITEGELFAPTCTVGGRMRRASDCRIWLAFGENRTEVLDKLTRARMCGTIEPVSSDTLPPLPSEEGSTASYALSLELQFLFESLSLRPVLPSCEHAEASFPQNLRRCIDESIGQLKERGFQTGNHHYFLPPGGDIPTDELLRACLRRPPRPTLVSPPMPPKSSIQLNELTLTVQKGRDLPPVCRLYENKSSVFFANSYTPAFRFGQWGEPIPFLVTLPEQSSGSTHECSLFHAAAAVCYSESEVRYSGEGYDIHATLSPEHPLLLLEVIAPLPADIRLALPAPSGQTEDSHFWHVDSDTVCFCSRILGDGRTVFLLGSFRRASDRLYYRIREDIDRRISEGKPLVDRSPSPAQLTWQSPPPYFAPRLIHPVLASNSPEAFPLLLFFKPSAAHDALVRLFETDNPLMQVVSCLLWQSSDDPDSLRQKIVHSTPSGSVEESIYLASARALDRLCEEASDRPLLSCLVTAFANLAHLMGDFAGEELYRSKTFTPRSLPPSPEQAESLEEIACLLLSGDPRGVAAWKARIDALPLFPSPEEAAALWSLFWYGVLGYRPLASGFSLHPLLCEPFDRFSFTLRQKDTLYQINISFSAHASCLLDGKDASAPFLFDKKTHFLEITVEKSK